MSSNEALISLACLLATQARDSAPHHQNSQIGFNYKMRYKLVGIGIGHTEFIDQRIKQKSKNFDSYKTLL